MDPGLKLTFLFDFIVCNGPPRDTRITPENSGEGGKNVKDTTTKGSVPDENAGKPDPGKPGGPSPNAEPPEGGKGGATGDGPKADGGTDVAAGGGAAGTNVKPVGPKKPVPKPSPPKPSPNQGGPGSPTTPAQVLYRFSSILVSGKLFL